MRSPEKGLGLCGAGGAEPARARLRMGFGSGFSPSRSSSPRPVDGLGPGCLRSPLVAKGKRREMRAHSSPGHPESRAGAARGDVPTAPKRPGRCRAAMSQRQPRKPRQGKFGPRPSKRRAGRALFALPGNGGAGELQETPPLGSWAPLGDGLMTPGVGRGSPGSQPSLAPSPGRSRRLFPPRAHPGKGDLGAGGLQTPGQSQRSSPRP